MNAAVAPATLTVRRTIAAPAEELFDAWLDPVALAAWMMSDGTRRTTASVQPRVGGRYEILMQVEDRVVPHTGEYRVIDRPHQLVFTWFSPYTGGCATLVTVDFVSTGGKTEVVLTHEQLPEASRPGHGRGWASGLEKLEQYFGSGKGG